MVFLWFSYGFPGLKLEDSTFSKKTVAMDPGKTDATQDFMDWRHLSWEVEELEMKQNVGK